MKKLSILTMIICLLSILFVSAEASSYIKLIQNVKNGEAIRTIYVEGQSSDAYVSFAVIQPGQSPSNTDVNIENAIKTTFQMLKNIPVGEDGKYSYSYPFKGAAGVYTVKVGTDAQRMFTVIEAQELISLFAQLNLAQSSGEVASIFETYKAGLGLEWMDSYTMDKDKLNGIMLENKPFEDLEAAIDLYYQNAIALIMGSTINTDKCVQLLQQQETLMQLDKISSYSLYQQSFDSAKKQEAISHLSNCKINNYQNFVTFFAQQIVLTALEHTQSYGEVPLLLKKYTDIIDIDWASELAGIKDPTSIYKGLMKKYFSSKDTLKEELVRLAALQRNAEKPKEEGKATVISGDSGSKSRPQSAQVPAVAPIAPIVPIAKETFNDLEDYSWSKESIKFLVEKNALNGYGNGIFAPSDYVTREQFVKTIVLAFSLQSDGKELDFSDVEKSQWYYDSIRIAVNTGIINGKGEKTFGTRSFITREEMATIVYRAIKAVTKNENSVSAQINFIDGADISLFANESIGAMVGLKIINGFEDGSFKPKANCTRAEMSKVIADAYIKGGIQK